MEQNKERPTNNVEEAAREYCPACDGAIEKVLVEAHKCSECGGFTGQITHVSIPSITPDELKKLYEAQAELMSLRQSIKESELAKLFPEREMSFHDKVVFAIADMHSRTALPTVEEASREYAQDLRKKLSGVNLPMPDHVKNLEAIIQQVEKAVIHGVSLNSRTALPTVEECVEKAKQLGIDHRLTVKELYLFISFSQGSKIN